MMTDNIMVKRRNSNDLQNTTQKTKNRAPLKTGGEFGGSGREM